MNVIEREPGDYRFLDEASIAAMKAQEQVAVTSFRKRPIWVQGVKWTGKNITDVLILRTQAQATTVLDQHEYSDVLALINKKDRQRVEPGDYILSDTKGSLYCCPKDVMENNYELEEPDYMAQAAAAYHRYAEVTNFKNFQGNPMPAFENLPVVIQNAWIAAAGR